MTYDPRTVPPKIGWYLAGFADGEGSFMIVFRKRKDYSTGIKPSLAFNVAQKDKVILALFKRYLKCGTLRQRRDGVWYYEVNNLNAIKNHVIPFFKRYRFLSSKKKKIFRLFVQAMEVFDEGKHLTKEGIERLKALRDKMIAIRNS